MLDLTVAMPFYRNQGMLSLQYREWDGWARKRLGRTRFILIDDGSPEPAADVPRPEGIDIEIYRVTEDRPWHQHGARNLGAYVAPEGWLLLTDMDHMLTDYAARALFKRIDTGAIDPSQAYMLSRVEADTGEPTLNDRGKHKPHPNSFVMTRAKYWEVGGYDEDLCGHYGTDSAFRTRLGRLEVLPVPLTRYWRDLVPDASTVGMPRKEGREPGVIRRIVAEKAARGEGPKVLAFDWERVV